MVPATELRVLVDANVLFAAFGWPRFPYAVIRHAMLGDFQLLLSDTIIQEARDAVLEHFGDDRMAHFDAFIEASNHRLIPSPSHSDIEQNLALVRDPKDVHVALAALRSGAMILVTSDKDLSDPSAEALHQQVAVLLPGTFLRVHMGWSSEALESIRRRTWDDMT